MTLQSCNDKTLAGSKARAQTLEPELKFEDQPAQFGENLDLLLVVGLHVHEQRVGLETKAYLVVGSRLLFTSSVIN